MKNIQVTIAVLLAALICCGSTMACGIKGSKGTHGTDSTEETGK